MLTFLVVTNSFLNVTLGICCGVIACAYFKAKKNKLQSVNKGK